MMSGSWSELILAMMRAGNPCFARSASPVMRSSSVRLHRGGGRDQALEAQQLRAAGDGVEEERGVVAILRLAGEIGDVGVEPGGGLVVVAGAEVDVAAQVAGLAADDHADLGVGLEALHAIDDLRAGALEFVGAVEVAGLVEAGLEFDEHGDVLAVFRGLDEGVDDAGLAGGAIEHLLDGDDVGIDRGLLDEAQHRLEGFVGMVTA